MSAAVHPGMRLASNLGWFALALVVFWLALAGTATLLSPLGLFSASPWVYLPLHLVGFAVVSRMAGVRYARQLDKWTTWERSFVALGYALMGAAFPITLILLVMSVIAIANWGTEVLPMFPSQAGVVLSAFISPLSLLLVTTGFAAARLAIATIRENRA